MSSGFFGSPSRAAEDAQGRRIKAADSAVERALRESASRWRPGDGFIGQEHGVTGSASCRWIVDAIDGTAAFRAGRDEWATLIAFEEDHQLLLGLATAPALRRRWWAVRGEGAWAATIGEPNHWTSPLKVTGTASRTGVRIGCWFGPDGDDAGGLELSEFRRDFPTVTSEGVRPSWGSGHPNGALLVASGRLDLFIPVGGGPWDHAAPAVIVEEAGGRFSDLSGQPRIDTGVGLFSNTRLHDAALVLNRR